MPERRRNDALTASPRRFWRSGEPNRSVPTGVDDGQLLWLSPQTPIDYSTGTLVKSLWDLPDDITGQLATGLEHRDGREGPIIAQTWMVYTNLESILRSQGSSLDKVVRQRIYVVDHRDIHSMEETMLRFFPSNKPATTISGVSRSGMHPDIRIQVELVAMAGPVSVDIAERIYDPELEELTKPYPQAVKVGQLLFFSGIVGTNPASARAVRRLSELDEESRKTISTRNYNGDTVEEAFKAQIATCFSHMARVMKPLGGTTDDLLRSNFLITRGMEEWGVSSMVFRKNMYSTQSAAPTSTCVTVPFINGDAEIVAVTDALALLPGRWKKESVINSATDMAYLPMSIAAGPYAFHTGFISMDKDFHGPVERLNQLDAGARALIEGRVDNSETILAQAWHIYREIDQMLRAVGSDLNMVVQQTLLLRDARDYALVEQVGRLWFDDALPATTIVPCDDIGPYPGLLLEIESVAVRRSTPESP